MSQAGEVKPGGAGAVLEGPWAGIDRLWRKLLADLLAEVWSTTRAEELIPELENDPWLTDLAGRWPDLDGDGRREAVNGLGVWLTRVAYATRPHCIRCGRCCRTGGPALLADEAELIRPDGPFYGQVYTIRAGEPVLDARRGEIRAVDRERIKIREKNGVCVFYDREKGCTVYADRPTQCRTLECWQAESSAWAEDGPFLDRTSAVEGDRTRLDYIAAHQAKCASEGLPDLLRAVEAGDPAARERLTNMVGFDLHVRRFAVEKGALAEQDLDLVLGRPLALVLGPLGWRVDVADGTLKLVREEDR